MKKFRLISGFDNNNTPEPHSSCTLVIGRSKLKGGYLTNIAASPRYLKIYDLDSPANFNTHVPALTLMIPGNTSGAGAILQIPPEGLDFLRGIAVVITNGYADNDLAIPGVGEVIANLWCQ
jgi:hypothetical protein